MKKVYFIAFLIASLVSCKKDTPKFIDVESADITKYVINHTGNKINFYSRYLNEVLQQTVYFYDHDTIIEKITKNNLDKIINKEIFFIGDNGYAESSIDSSFKDSVLSYINTKTYQYNNDFLVQTVLNYKNFGTNSDSGQVTISNSISDENIISSNVAFPNYSTGCTDHYNYNNNANIIDVRYFSNGIAGKISKNLIAHASWNNGCPAGPSMTIASSDFEYIFTSSNNISVMKETYTPCYHMGDTKKVIRTIRLTYYQY